MSAESSEKSFPPPPDETRERTDKVDPNESGALPFHLGPHGGLLLTDINPRYAFYSGRRNELKIVDTTIEPYLREQEHVAAIDPTREYGSRELLFTDTERFEAENTTLPNSLMGYVETEVPDANFNRLYYIHSNENTIRPKIPTLKKALLNARLLMQNVNHELLNVSGNEKRDPMAITEQDTEDPETKALIRYHFFARNLFHRRVGFEALPNVKDYLHQLSQDEQLDIVQGAIRIALTSGHERSGNIISYGSNEAREAVPGVLLDDRFAWMIERLDPDSLQFLWSRDVKHWIGPERNPDADEEERKVAKRKALDQVAEKLRISPAVVLEKATKSGARESAGNIHEYYPELE